MADTSVRYDREVKIPLYARFAIPEVWLIDLKQKRVEIYIKPGDGEYSSIQRHRSGKIACSSFPETVVDVTELFA